MNHLRYFDEKLASFSIFDYIIKYELKSQIAKLVLEYDDKRETEIEIPKKYSLKCYDVTQLQKNWRFPID